MSHLKTIIRFNKRMIKHACYYITNNNNVSYFDRDGNLLVKELVPIKVTKYDNTSYNDHDKEFMESRLDPEVKGKARPATIRIFNHFKMGRCLSFVDKNDNVIYYTRYDGPNDRHSINAFCASVLTASSGPHSHKNFSIDLQWLGYSPIPIVEDKSKECVIC